VRRRRRGRRNGAVVVHTGASQPVSTPAGVELRIYRDAEDAITRGVPAAIAGAVFAAPSSRGCETLDNARPTDPSRAATPTGRSAPATVMCSRSTHTTRRSRTRATRDRVRCRRSGAGSTGAAASRSLDRRLRMPDLTIEVVDPPTRTSGCGGARSKVRWKVAGGKSGWVIQHIVWTIDRRDCSGNPKPPKDLPGEFWEAWKVTNGRGRLRDRAAPLDAAPPRRDPEHGPGAAALFGTGTSRGDLQGRAGTPRRL
jgi:hypothetical protein